MLRFPEMAGVTVQLPRMLCRTAAAAPGCPAIDAYCADWASRPNRITAASAPSITPSGIISPSRPVNTPIRMQTTRTPSPAAATSSRPRGLDLRIRPATIRICLTRPGGAWAPAC